MNLKNETSEIILSIIVPVHNTIEYLKKCLDTLTNQNIKNFEIIVIDDNSNEDIKKVTEMYTGLNFELIYIRLSSSKGPGGARNVGLKNARGTYIGFCDSDDWLDLDYYKTGIEYMNRSNADIGMFSQIREYDYTPRKTVYKCKYDTYMELTPDMTIKIMTYQFDVGIKVIPPCINKIYKKRFLESIQAKFEEHMYFQDVLFSFQTILSANRVICIPGTKYHHYKRPDSIIQSFDEKHIQDFGKLFELIRQFLVTKKIFDNYVMNYYKLLDHFYNIIIREIFQFVQDERSRKKYICQSFSVLKHILVFKEYIEYASAEELRRHIQPDIIDTTLY